MKKLKVLALLTDRRSNNNQVLTLASLLSDDNFFTKTVFFNLLIKIPNRLARFFIPVWMTIKKSDNFFDIEDCDIIVTGGRQAARYAIHLKKTMYKNAKIIQIMNPDLDSRYLDLILLPSHDSNHIKKYRNILTYHGSIFHKFSDDAKKKSVDDFKNEILKHNGPYISVFIGGSSRKYKFNKESADLFIKKINEISKNMKASLLITTSRRTDSYIIESIKKNIDLDVNYFYKFDSKSELNPFLSLVHFGDYFIVTGDSISMVNELITLKPLYVYNEGMNSKKYALFYKFATEIGGVKIINSDTQILEKFETKSLNSLDQMRSDVLGYLKLDS